MSNYDLVASLDVGLLSVRFVGWHSCSPSFTMASIKAIMGDSNIAFTVPSFGIERMRLELALATATRRSSSGSRIDCGWPLCW